MISTICIAFQLLLAATIVVQGCNNSDPKAETLETPNQSVSLDKYSYLLYGFNFEPQDKNGMYPYTSKVGTAFFVRHKKRLYLVTAKHSISPLICDSPSLVKKSPDTFRVRVLSSDLTKAQPMIVDVKAIKDTIKHRDCHDPDIIVIPITHIDDPKFPIFSLEEYIGSAMSYDSGEIVTYGYPSANDDLNKIGLDRFLSQQVKVMEGKITHNLDPFYADVNFEFSTSNHTEPQGRSGSPVFVKNSNRWLLAGVFIRGRVDLGVDIVVKSNFILERVKELEQSMHESDSTKKF